MGENIEDKINEFGWKLEIIQSIMRAINSALFGTDELKEKDGYSLAFLLEEKIDDLTHKHNELVTNLKI